VVDDADASHQMQPPSDIIAINRACAMEAQDSIKDDVVIGDIGESGNVKPAEKVIAMSRYIVC